MVTLNASGGSVPARDVSCSKMKRRVIDQPGPPYVLRPQRCDPSLPEQDSVPEQHLLLAQIGLGIGDTHFLRIVLRDEGAHLVAKRGILAGKAKLHRR